jgi:hypothetical protein
LNSWDIQVISATQPQFQLNELRASYQKFRVFFMKC